MAMSKKNKARSKGAKPVRKLGKKAMRSDKGGIIAILIGARAVETSALPAVTEAQKV